MSQNLYRQVGKRVKAHRKLARLTQDQLAQKANLSVHYLSRIETGSAAPTLDSLERVAEALGAQIGELFQFRKGEAQEAKGLLHQIQRLLKNRRPEELRMARNLVGQIVELLPPIKQR